MSASDSITPAPTDATLAAKWAAAVEDGNTPRLTLAELARLIALPGMAAERPFLLDAYVCELEASGTDADVRALDPTATGGDVDDDCPACSGTGLGSYDGGRCTLCGGSGCAFDAPVFDEPYDLDDVAFDAYMCDAFAAAVGL